MHPPQHAHSNSNRAGGRTLVIGVLGGIASGKSEVARSLAEGGGEVIDADELARAVLGSAEVRERLTRRFGPEIVTSSGAVDRARLASRVFAEPAARRELESWIHPRVREMIRHRLDSARANGAPVVVLDVPLLLENDREHKLVAECEALVFVDAAPEQREARAHAARAWPAGEVARRESTQLPLAHKRERADFVIANDRGRDELRAAARDVLRQIQARRATR